MKDWEIRQEMFQIAKSAAVILDRSKGNLAGPDAAAYDNRMIDFDQVAKEIGYNREGRDAKAVLKDMENAPVKPGIVEDIGERVNVQGTQGRRGRDKDGNEFRVWHPDEPIAPYAGTGRESEARMSKVLAAAVTGRMDELTAEERNLSQGSLASGGAHPDELEPRNNPGCESKSDGRADGGYRRSAEWQSNNPRREWIPDSFMGRRVGDVR